MRDFASAFFGRFAYPRVAALIFEGALLGTVGWLMLLVARVGVPALAPFGRVAMLVGIATVLLGAFGYLVLLINEALREGS